MRNRIISLTETTLSVRRTRIYDWSAGKHDRDAGSHERPTLHSQTARASSGKHMYAVSDVLRVANVTGGVFLHAEFRAAWCIVARVSPEHCAPALGPASHLIVYHYVVEGDLRIQVDGESEEVVIRTGEVVLL